MMTVGANKYKQTAVKTASSEQILLMLYEAAIRHVKKAIEHIETKNLEEKGIAIGKAHDIINELQNTLNFEIGGQIAIDLERLYSFMTEQLIKANIENNPEPLNVVAKLMETLLEGWRGAIDQNNKEKTKGAVEQK